MRAAPLYKMAGSGESDPNRPARSPMFSPNGDARRNRTPRRGGRAPYPNRSLRDFAAWPAGLYTYLEFGYRPGGRP